MTKIAVPDIDGPTAQLCWRQKLDPPHAMTRCDRARDHRGPHSWEIPAASREQPSEPPPLRAALERIWNYYGDCQCEHDDKDCCAMLSDTEYCCPVCIAAVALGKHTIPELLRAESAASREQPSEPPQTKEQK